MDRVLLLDDVGQDATIGIYDGGARVVSRGLDGQQAKVRVVVGGRDGTGRGMADGVGAKG